MSKTKSFKDTAIDTANPATRFISQPGAEATPAKGKTAKAARPASKGGAAAGHREPMEGVPVKPLYVETKSRKVQILIQPSLHELLKERAAKTGESVNETIHSILWAAFPDKGGKR